MSFLASLSYDDLRQLREVAKRVHMRHYADRHLTDIEADRIIEAIGPEIIEKQLKALVDRGIVS
jgi:uncharacterized membrane-anchored protein